MDTVALGLHLRKREVNFCDHTSYVEAERICKVPLVRDTYDFQQPPTSNAPMVLGCEVRTNRLKAPLAHILIARLYGASKDSDG